MLVEIENIGLFEKAQIEINGLCVIAGINDTGKSTLGKIIYSIIQGIKRYATEVEEYKDEKIASVTDEVFFLVRRHTLGNENKNYFEKQFFPPFFKKDIQDNPYSAINNRINLLENLDTEGDRHLKIATQRLYHLLAILTQKESKIELIKKSLTNAFLSEFEGQFCSKFTKNPSRISIKENDQVVIDITFENDKIVKLLMHHDLMFSDATLIDTPVIIQLSHLIKGCSSKFSNIKTTSLNVPLHWKDLNSKLVNSKYIFESDNSLGFNNLIGGGVNYDEENETFQYERYVDNYRFDVRAINTASGIKSLSIINLLLISGQLSTRTLLVIDEPEVNLHPEWQIEYAQLISRLVSFGVTIIVTTHSPYMIDAFKTFDSKYSLNTSFYLTKKCNRGLSKMYNLTNSVSEIIESLSKPLDTLHRKSLVGTLFDGD
ncbi:TPA: AAA family ATPase [Photobacterium damselae]